MAEMSLDQQRAMAMASARMRMSQQQGQSGGSFLDKAPTGLAGDVAYPGELVGKSLFGTGAAAVEAATNPVGAAVTMGKGVMDLPQTATKNLMNEQAALAQNMSDVVKPNVPGMMGGMVPRAISAGKALLGVAGMPFSPINSAIENTVGRLGQQATKGVVSPQETALLPEMLIGGVGGGKGKLAQKTAMTPMGELGKRLGPNTMKSAMANEAPKLAQEAMLKDLGGKQTNIPRGIADKTLPTTNRGANVRVSDVVQQGVNRTLAKNEKLYSDAEAVAAKHVVDPNTTGQEISKLINERPATAAPPTTAQEFVDKVTGARAALEQAKRQQTAVRLSGGAAAATDASQVNALRQRVLDLKKEAMEGPLGPIKQAELDLAQKRIDVATNQVGRNRSNIGAQASVANAKVGAKPPIPGKQDVTYGSLVAMDKELNGMNYAADVHSAYYKKLHDAVRTALDKGPPEVSQAYGAARKNYAEFSNAYGGTIAKELGISGPVMDQLKAARKGSPEATANVEAAMRELPSKIRTINQVQWLKRQIASKDAGPQGVKQFRELMGHTTADILQESGLDYDKFMANREILGDILGETGAKQKMVAQHLKTMEEGLKELKDRGIKLDMQPHEFDVHGKLLSKVMTGIKGLLYLSKQVSAPAGFGNLAKAVANPMSEEALRMKKLMDDIRDGRPHYSINPANPVNRGAVGGATVQYLGNEKRKKQ